MKSRLLRSFFYDVQRTVESQTRIVPRFESELRSINIEDDMNKHLHNTYIVANLLLHVLEYEQVCKDETKIIRLNEKALTYYLVNQSST